MTFVALIEDENEDLVDVYVFCSQFCAENYARSKEVSITDIPCYEPGSHAYCEDCADSIKHGANCFAALTNELTEECPEFKQDNTTGVSS